MPVARSMESVQPGVIRTAGTGLAKAHLWMAYCKKVEHEDVGRSRLKKSQTHPRVIPGTELNRGHWCQMATLVLAAASSVSALLIWV